MVYYSDFQLINNELFCKVGVWASQSFGFTTGIVDSSGLRLYYSPSLRRYDAGVIETGVWVSLYHMLPPGMQDYITEGHCTQECLQEVGQHKKTTTYCGYTPFTLYKIIFETYTTIETFVITMKECFRKKQYLGCIKLQLIKYYYKLLFI